MTPSAPLLDLAVRVGCELIYHTTTGTPAVVNFKPRQGLHQLIRAERMDFEPGLGATEFEDEHKNIVYRLTLRPGVNTLRYDAIVMVPSLREDFMRVDEPVPPQELPAEILRYTLPSRYCDSDKLLDFAWRNFGRLPHGIPRVLAICDWLHENIEYRTGSLSALLSAHEIIERGHGVCRDLAHAAIALCRTFNLPARYVSGYVTDIGVRSPGTPEDFHAYFEVWLGGSWQVFDARFNQPRIGRVRICAGFDAVNCAFTTLYGQADMTQFYVWSYQINPDEVRVGDPIDLSKRLCGTEELRRSRTSAEHTPSMMPGAFLMG